MRVLFDTNVVLDVLLNRHPYAAASIQLVDHAARRRIDGFLGATTVTTVHYLSTKAVGRRQAERHVRTLLDLFDVASVTRSVLADALRLGFPDYEDAALHEAARHAGADGIVTRDPAGFATASLSIYAPGELLRLLRARPEP
ncbi:MAG: PIN domain-containing protein [Armatimonadota bacterium]